MRIIISMLLICLVVQATAQTSSCDSIVYPGDFNRDGVVSVQDVLYWGLAYGQTGTPRPNATLDWTAQTSDDWTGIINDVNYNNQDANGNGIVDTLDLAAIYQNYDSTHNCIIKNPITTLVNGLHIDYNTLFNTDNTIKIHKYYIDVKDYDFHGFTFTFDYSGFANAFMAIEVDTIGGWLAPDALVTVNDAVNQQLHVAATRTDLMDGAYDGSHALVIIICEDIAGLTDQTKIYVNNIEGIRADYTRFEMADDSLTNPADIHQQVIYNGEQSGDENCLEEGIHNDTDAHTGSYCFEGFNLNTWNESIIALWCDPAPNYYNLSYYDRLVFYVKADQADKTLLFSLFPFFSDYYVPLNINDYIVGGSLTTTYQRVCIPLDDLIIDDCANFDCMLGEVDKLVFHSDDEVAFNFYVDDVSVIRGQLEGYESCDIIDALSETETPVNQLISYPNPVTQNLNFDIFYDKYIQANLEIIDLQGKVINNIPVNFSAGTNAFQYAIPHLQSGMYIIHIRDENGVSSYGKFMKM